MATRVEFTNDEANTVIALSPTYGPLVQDDAGQKYIDYIDIIEAQLLDVDVFGNKLNQIGITDKDIQDIKDYAHSLGVSEFTQLNDTPSTYTGQKGKIPIVRDAEDELIFTGLTYRADDLGTILQAINKTEAYTFDGDYLDQCTISYTDPSSAAISVTITSQTAHELNISVVTHATNTGDVTISIINPAGTSIGAKLVVEVVTVVPTITIIGDTGAVWQNTANFTGGVGTAEKSITGNAWNCTADTYTGFAILSTEDFELTWGIQDMGSTNFTVCGLSNIPGVSGHTVDFSFYTYSTSYYKAEENGVQIGSWATPMPFTTKFMIKAVGTTLTYHVDTGSGYTLFATSPTTRNMTLYVDFKAYSQMRIINLTASVV